MNHVMHTDDICVMAPRAIAVQKLFFNPVKSVCIVFKPCRFKLYCPAVFIGTKPLTYVNTVKYLGFVFCENKKDDGDMLNNLKHCTPILTK